MKIKFPILVLILFVFGIKLHAQSNFSSLIGQRLNDYLIDNLQEKIYVQTNSNEYTPGDTIWFKSTLVNAATHTPANKEKMIYIDLVSPENKVVYHQVFFIFGGFSAGSMHIKRDFKFGTYKLIAYTNYMRNFSKDFFFQKDIEILKAAQQPVSWEFNPKISKSEGGDSVTVYMNSRSENGKDVYSEADITVQLARGNVLGGKCKLTNNTGNFKFFVPDSLRLPMATLTITLPFQKNVLERFKIELSPSKPDLQFLPESGALIPIRLNNVAFKCIDASGIPLEIEGKIYDEDHEFISNFHTVYKGMGTVDLLPDDSVKYQAEIKWKGETFSYDLPMALPNSYGIYLQEETLDSLLFNIIKPTDDKEPISILGHTRGVIKFFVSGNIDTKESKLAVPKADFPSGVAVFTLMVKNYPRAERLVYIENDDQLSIEIYPNKTHFKKRDKVELNLRITDQDGYPVVGSFSLNAFDAGTERTIHQTENIQNYLLCSSDLKGKIINDPDLFNKSNPNYKRNIDLLMLTNGWRRFKWSEIYSTEKKEKAYPIEEGLSLKGEIKRAINNKPVPKNFEVSVSLSRRTPFFVDKTKTDEFGKFHFALPEFTDSAMLVIQTMNRLKMKNDYLIDIESNLERLNLSHLSWDRVSRISATPIISSQLNFSNTASFGSNLPNRRDKRVDSYYFPGVDTFLIEEVEVNSNFLSNRDSLIYQTGEPDVVIESTQLKKIVEENPWYNDIWDLLMDQIPGLNITRYPYNQLMVMQANLMIPDYDPERDPVFDYIYFRCAKNSGARLIILVDGEPLQKLSVDMYDFLTFMDPSDIESVNFIANPKNYENATFDAFDNNSYLNPLYSEQIDPFVEVAPGSDDFSSAINKLQADFDLWEDIEKNLRKPAYLFITTKSKSGVNPYKPKGIATLYLNGFTDYKEFYTPKYLTEEDKNQPKPDYRKTLYWNPNIVTDENGDATVSFYTNDTHNPISIMMQGLSKAGKTGAKFIQLNESNSPLPVIDEAVVTEVKPKTENIDYNYLQLIGGTVIDADTKKPIISANITQADPYYQACCNMEGEFFIEKQQLSGSDNLVVTCPGYDQQSLSVNNINSNVITIELKKAPVIPLTTGKNGKTIVLQSINKSDNYYGKNNVFQGYFREAISVNSNAYGIYESYFNFTNKGYSGNHSTILFETEKFKNMEDKNGHRLLILKPNHRNRFYPLKADVLSFTPAFFNYNTLNEFEYEMVGEVEYAGKMCYKIVFDQTDDCIHPFEKGIIYIEKESFALLCAQWEMSPKGREYISYTNFLQSNPLDYKLEVIGNYCEANYAFNYGKLILQSTKDKIEISVNNSDIIKFERVLSINAESAKPKKHIINSTWNSLKEDGKSKHILIQDAQYTLKPWVRLGIVKPESYLLRDAKFMHDVYIYR